MAASTSRMMTANSASTELRRPHARGKDAAATLGNLEVLAVAAALDARHVAARAAILHAGERRGPADADVGVMRVGGGGLAVLVEVIEGALAAVRRAFAHVARCGGSGGRAERGALAVCGGHAGHRARRGCCEGDGAGALKKVVVAAKRCATLLGGQVIVVVHDGNRVSKIVLGGVACRMRWRVARALAVVHGSSEVPLTFALF